MANTTVSTTAENGNISRRTLIHASAAAVAVPVALVGAEARSATTPMMQIHLKIEEILKAWDAEDDEWIPTDEERKPYTALIKQAETTAAEDFADVLMKVRAGVTEGGGAYHDDLMGSVRADADRLLRAAGLIA